MHDWYRVDPAVVLVKLLEGVPVDLLVTNRLEYVPMPVIVVPATEPVDIKEEFDKRVIQVVQAAVTDVIKRD